MRPDRGSTDNESRTVRAAIGRGVAELEAVLHKWVRSTGYQPRFFVVRDLEKEEPFPPPPSNPWPNIIVFVKQYDKWCKGDMLSSDYHPNDDNTVFGPWMLAKKPLRRRPSPHNKYAKRTQKDKSTGYYSTTSRNDYINESKYRALENDNSNMDQLDGHTYATNATTNTKKVTTPQQLSIHQPKAHAETHSLPHNPKLAQIHIMA
ncbi:hypothetical protein E2542_SST15807 [Spatholobus suberectus]|nr:hypothetical protein E2542_SST15807 [Spatholobus suberectus]